MIYQATLSIFFGQRIPTRTKYTLAWRKVKYWGKSCKFRLEDTYGAKFRPPLHVSLNNFLIRPSFNENAGALARPPATRPPCHYSKQKVLLTVIFVCSKYNCSLWVTETQAQFNYHMMWHYGVTWRHDVTLRYGVTSRHDVMPWHQMTPYEWQRESAWVKSENPKITFFNLVILTFDLWPWPLNSYEISSMSNPTPNFRSVC